MFDKLEGSVLLIKDQSIDIADHNWNFSSLEKELQLLPIVFLFRIIFGVIKTMHLNFRWEVAREDLSDEESIVESSTDVFDRVGEIKRL